MRYLWLVLLLSISGVSHAGYIVDGYCHSDISEARLHFDDLLTSGNKSLAQFSSGTVVAFRVTDNGSPGSDSVKVDITAVGTASVDIPLPQCDSAFDDGPMPWGVVSSQSSSAWDGAYTLEFVGSLVAAAWAVWGIAFLARTSFRIFR